MNQGGREPALLPHLWVPSVPSTTDTWKLAPVMESHPPGGRSLLEFLGQLPSLSLSLNLQVLGRPVPKQSCDPGSMVHHRYMSLDGMEGTWTCTLCQLQHIPGTWHRPSDLIFTKTYKIVTTERVDDSGWILVCKFYPLTLLSSWGLTDLKQGIANDQLDRKSPASLESQWDFTYVFSLDLTSW